jgi:hypothetical protein
MFMKKNCSLRFAATKLMVEMSSMNSLHLKHMFSRGDIIPEDILMLVKVSLLSGMDRSLS